MLYAASESILQKESDINFSDLLNDIPLSASSLRPVLPIAL